MVTIETKYLDYCKACRILRQSPNEGPQQKQSITPLSMKTNTIKAIIATLVLGLAAGFASTKVTGGDLITALTITLGYLTVAGVVAIAAADYKSSAKA